MSYVECYTLATTPRVTDRGWLVFPGGYDDYIERAGRR